MIKQKHAHAEAFMLMTYASRDGRELEAIWNSRDGVTPFIVFSEKSGAELQHVDWQKDVYNPNHVPRPGDRVFVDMTPERAREVATERVEEWWDHPEFPASAMFDSKEDAVAEVLKDFPPGSPSLITIGLEGWRP